MSLKNYCKKCGRKLTSKESILRGYGKTCYKTVQLQEQRNKPNEELIELKNLYNQLSLKYSILEKKVNKLIEKGLVVLNMENTERIKLDNCVLELNEFKNEFSLVIKELKTIFNIEDFSYRKILKPIKEGLK